MSKAILSQGRIIGTVIIVFVLYAVYAWWSTRNTDSFFDINQQVYAPAEVSRPRVEAPIERVVAPGGPNAPNQAPLQTQPSVVMPEEMPYDPQDQSYESAEIPERLRHPERMFSPGIVNDGTDGAIASGIASQATQATMQAYQAFGPEFATNGGSFLDNGVMANDTTVSLDFSSV